MTKKEILETLPTLEIDDLEELINKCQYLKTTKTLTEDDEDLELFYLILITAIKKKTGEDFSEYFIFKRTKTFKEVKKTVKFIKEHVSSILNIEVKKLPKRIFLDGADYFCNLSIKYLEEKNIPLTITTLLNMKNSFPSLLSNEFPEYIESGFAFLIFSEESFGPKEVL